MTGLLGDGFVFVETAPMDEERKRMGWQTDAAPPYVVRSREAGDEKCLELAEQSDVVLFGRAPFRFVKKRIAKNRLTFFYLERLFKKGYWREFFSLKWLRLLATYAMPNRKSNSHMLCASAFLADDLRRIRAFQGRAYKWGYFPECRRYDVAELLRNKEKHSLLWAGRLVAYKRPEDAILALDKIPNTNVTLDMIGVGERERRLKELANRLGLSDRVRFLGAMTPDDVRSRMEKADIFLFTSNAGEGWGAVLNEAMNSGCRVIAASAIGSVPFLAQNGVNAIVYQAGDVDDLARKIERELDTDSDTGARAYQTIASEWNAQVAAERLVLFSQGLLRGEKPCFETGPLSEATVIPPDWYSPK